MSSPFPSRMDYNPPSREDLTKMFMARRGDVITLEHASDRDDSVDIRDKIRLFLFMRQVQINSTTWKRLVEPYDLGFDRKSDGKSHPLPWFRNSRYMNLMGFRKHIVAVWHDLVFYRGWLTVPGLSSIRVHDSSCKIYGHDARKQSNRDYRRMGIELGETVLGAWLDLRGLMLGSRRFWNQHRNREAASRMAREVPAYGSNEYIHLLPDI